MCKRPQRWPGGGYLRASPTGLCGHRFPEEFELALHGNFCVTPITVEVECSGKDISGEGLSGVSSED